MRKKLMLSALTGVTLGAVGGCARTDQSTFATACPGASAAVRSVTDVPGTVTFDETLQRYKITAPEVGAVDAVNVGVVCGTLPRDLRKEGAKVLFSGTYEAYPNPPAAPGGYTTYYLELADVKAL